MTAPASLDGRILVVGLDAWGDRVSEAAGAQLGHPLMAELHVLVASELADPEATRGQLILEGCLLGGHGMPFVTVVQAADGVWIGPTVVPGLPGCTVCWYARRGEGLGLLTAADGPRRRGRRRDDVGLAARSLIAVADRLRDGSPRSAALVRRCRTAGGPPELGRLSPAPGCQRCDGIDGIDAIPPGASRAAQRAPRRATVISIGERR